MNGAQRDQTQSLGFKALQVFGSVPGGAHNDPFGNPYSFSNLALLLGAGARYQYEDTYGDAIYKLKQVADTPGIIGNWIIWPGDPMGSPPRTFSQIAQVFAVQVVSVGPLKVRPLQIASNTPGIGLDTSLKALPVVTLDGSLPGVGIPGIVVAGTSLGSQELLFFPDYGAPAPSAGPGLGWYGDGSDGDLVFDGSTNVVDQYGNSLSALGWQAVSNNNVATIPNSLPSLPAAGYWAWVLQNDVYARNITINATGPFGLPIFVIPNGFTICFTGTLTCNGRVSSAGGHYQLGFVSPAPNWTSIGGNVAGGTGSGGPGSGGSPVSNSTWNQGQAGSGGSDGGANAGGGGALPTDTNGYIKRRAMPDTAMGYTFINGSLAFLGGGCGGGAGGGGASTIGGWGGGITLLRGKTITGGGIIDADGGDGQGQASGINMGGSGGGNGGLAFVMAESISGVTIRANGGVGSAPFGTGVAGTNGQPGFVMQGNPLH